MIRVGVVGTSGAALTHLAALQAASDAAVVAVCDAPTERAQERAAQFGVSLDPDLGAVAGQVDALWVCSPPHLHAEHVATAARQGCHVFVERPIAHNLAAADQIIDACRQAGVRLMIGHSLRYSPLLQRMRRLLADGELGTLVSCWSRRYGDASPSEMSWWLRDWRRGGGVTLEWGIQELDAVRWLGESVAGTVLRVHGRTVFSHGDYPEFDAFSRATLTFQNGAVGGFEAGMSAPLGGGLSRGVLGSRAMVIVEGRALRLRYTGDGAERVIDVPPANDPERRINLAVLAQDGDFLRAIAEEREPPITGQDGRTSLAICLAVHASSREGREITLAETA